MNMFLKKGKFRRYYFKTMYLNNYTGLQRKSAASEIKNSAGWQKDAIHQLVAYSLRKDSYTDYLCELLPNSYLPFGRKNCIKEEKPGLRILIYNAGLF